MSQGLLNLLLSILEILHCRKGREYQEPAGRCWKTMSDLEEIHKSFPRHWHRETEKFGQGWDAQSLDVLTPGQMLLLNKPELKVQTPKSEY